MTSIFCAFVNRWAAKGLRRRRRAIPLRAEAKRDGGSRGEKLRRNCAKMPELRIHFYVNTVERDERMDKIRVMLADDNQSILRLLSDFFARKEDIELVASVSDGTEIMDAVREHAPDILVMDIIMPRMDGFMALEELRQMDEAIRPKVIVLTGLARDDFIMRAIRLGASYYMVKPFDMHLLYSRIVEVAGNVPEAAVAAAPEGAPGEESLDEQITNLFLTLGIPAHIKGYQYLREAVHMVIDNHDVINRITKELYPGVARRFETSASKVERAMRHAIEVAWSRGRLDSVNRMYGYKVFDAMDKPTNGEFISCVAEKLGPGRSA